MRRKLNSGLSKAVSNCQTLIQDLRRCQDVLNTLEARNGSGDCPQLEQVIHNAMFEIDPSFSTIFLLRCSNMQW